MTADPPHGTSASRMGADAPAGRSVFVGDERRPWQLSLLPEKVCSSLARSRPRSGGGAARPARGQRVPCTASDSRSHARAVRLLRRR